MPALSPAGIQFSHLAAVVFKVLLEGIDILGTIHLARPAGAQCGKDQYSQFSTSLTYGIAHEGGHQDNQKGLKISWSFHGQNG